MSRRSIWAVLAATAVLSGCSSFYDARFAPAPAEVVVAHADAPDLSARVLATVRGVRRPTREQPRARFEVAMRVENTGRGPLELAPDGFELVTADLRVLAPGRTTPEPVGSIAPNEGMAFDVAFELPEGVGYSELDLRGVVLRWTLVGGGARLVSSVSFERRVLSHEPVYVYGGLYGYWPRWRPHSRVGTFCTY